MGTVSHVWPAVRPMHASRTSTSARPVGSTRTSSCLWPTGAGSANTSASSSSDRPASESRGLLVHWHIARAATVTAPRISRPSRPSATVAHGTGTSFSHNVRHTAAAWPSGVGAGGPEGTSRRARSRVHRGDTEHGLTQERDMARNTHLIHAIADASHRTTRVGAGGPEGTSRRARSVHRRPSRTPSSRRTGCHGVARVRGSCGHRARGRRMARRDFGSRLDRPARGCPGASGTAAHRAHHGAHGGRRYRGPHPRARR